MAKLEAGKSNRERITRARMDAAKASQVCCSARFDGDDVGLTSVRPETVLFAAGSGPWRRAVIMPSCAWRPCWLVVLVSHRELSLYSFGEDGA
jgi:hypothetical protein